MADEAAQTPTDSDGGDDPVDAPPENGGGGDDPVDAPPEDDDGGDEPADAPPDGGDEAGGLDLDAERERLDEVENKIEEGRRALADAEDDVEPEPDGPPVAAGEDAANAPPG